MSLLMDISNVRVWEGGDDDSLRWISPPHDARLLLSARNSVHVTGRDRLSVEDPVSVVNLVRFNIPHSSPC